MTGERIVVVTLRDARADSATTYLRPEQMRGALARDPTVAHLEPGAYMGSLDVPGDVVRARSNAVEHVLRERSDATHVVWWDDDVMPPSLATVGHLVHSGHDVVGCPVPRKYVARWTEGEHGAYDYAYRLNGPDGGSVSAEADGAGCIEVDALPFGLLCTSTAALRMLCAHYGGQLWYTHASRRVVALFQLMLTPEVAGPDGPHRELLSEDYSFCRRWRQLGGRVHMLLEPCAHVGGHVYRGDVRGLRWVR